MLVDPIRSSEPQQVQPAAAVRADNARPRVSNTPRAPVPVVKPVAPQPDNSDEVQVQWNANDGVVVQITDKKSGELIRQIPSEQVLNVAGSSTNCCRKSELRLQPNKKQAAMGTAVNPAVRYT